MNFESLIKSFGIIINREKKIQCFVRLQILIVLRSLLRLENQVKWTWGIKWEKWGEQWIKNSGYQVKLGNLSYPEPNYTLMDLNLLLFISKISKIPYSIYINQSFSSITSIILLWSILLQGILTPS